MATASKTTKKSTKSSGTATAADKAKDKATTKKTAEKSAAKSTAKSTEKTATKSTAKQSTPKEAAKPAAKKAETKSAAKPAARKSAPASSAKAGSKPATNKAAEAPAAKTEKSEPAKPVRRDKLEFAVEDYVVYPTHGVGKVTAIEEHTIAGEALTLFVIDFERERMTLKVPVAKVSESGLRKLSNRKIIDSALKTLKGRSRVKRTMWSRRAQEYEAKINSGDPVSIAEVVRDLHRNADQPDQSYSERQMYQAALDRLARELAAVESVEHDMAVEKLEKLLKAA